MSQGAALPAEYRFIETPGALREYCATLRQAERLAVDTEFVGEKTFYPRLEVIQIRGEEGPPAVIDVHAVGDLGPLAELIGDKDRLKIFHASSQDVEILRRALGVLPLPLFDTQVAAALVGYGAQISLANLIRSILSVEVSGKHTTSDWSHRPLNEGQLVYAAADVLHLHALHESLVAGLEERQRLYWYRDEQEQRLAGILANGDEPPETLYRRVKDWASLRPKELAVLRELAIWRDATARGENLPRRTIMTDETLVELARFHPPTKEKARRLRRAHPGQINRRFDEVLPIVQRGLAIPREQWPEKPVNERPDIPPGLMELCQALIRTRAEEEAVAATIIVTSSDVQQLLANRKSLDEERHAVLRGWRREVVGEQLLDLLQGRLAALIDAETGALRFTPVDEVGARQG